MKAVIFANGIMNQWPSGFELSMEKDLIIAADGGFKHCRQWNVMPHIIVGDMDSVSSSDLETHSHGEIEIHRFPARKDETDLHLALQTAVDRNAGEIVILGALGARWDMTFSNVFILLTPFLRGIDVRILEGQYELLCLHGHHKINLQGKPGNIVSLIPLAGPASGVTLGGFEFTLDKETLPVGTTRGISNLFKDNKVEIEIEKGHLLVVIDRTHDNRKPMAGLSGPGI
jgi:thiamine pyrophosphokinase